MRRSSRHDKPDFKYSHQDQSGYSGGGCGVRNPDPAPRLSRRCGTRQPSCTALVQFMPCDLIRSSQSNGRRAQLCLDQLISQSQRNTSVFIAAAPANAGYGALAGRNLRSDRSHPGVGAAARSTHAGKSKGHPAKSFSGLKRRLFATARHTRDNALQFMCEIAHSAYCL